jgi:hypothetical protein
MAQSNTTQDDVVQRWLEQDSEYQRELAKFNKEKRQYWKKYLQTLLRPYKTDSMLNQFVTNRAVTGAFGEALVRKLIQQMLPHLRISTGAILSLRDHVNLEEQDIKYDKIPQGDLIIWDPSVLPAAIDVGDFALVSNLAARGVIEVKRTNTSIKQTREKLGKWRQYLSRVPMLHGNKMFMDCQTNILGVVIKHRNSLCEEEPLPEMWDWKNRFGKPPVMVRLFGTKYSEDIDGFLTLIFFLAHIAKQPEKMYFGKVKQLEERVRKLEETKHLG